MAMCGLLVPGASKSSRLITPAGCSARYLRLSRVVVFVVFALRSPCMMMMVCVYGVGGGKARVLVGTRAAQNMALSWPCSPAPSRLVGLDNVDVVGVEVAWVLLVSDFFTM